MIVQRKVKSSKEISFWRQQFIDDGVMTALCIVGFAFFSWIGWHIDPFWFCVVTVAGVTCGFLIFRFRPRRQWVLQVLMLSTVVVMMFIGGNQVPRLRFLGINWMVGVYMGAAAISSWERFVRRRGLLNRTNYVLAQFGTKVRFVGLGEFAERVSGLNGGTRTVVSGIVGEARLDVAGDAKDRLVVWFSHSSGDEDAWRVLVNPEATERPVLPLESAEPLIQVCVDGVRCGYAAWETVTLSIALKAVRQFMKDGTARKDLMWFSSPEVADRRPLPSASAE